MPSSLLLQLVLGTADAACPTATPAFTVCPTCTKTTINSALASAVDGDVICVVGGTYTEKITFSGNRRVRLEQDGAVTLDGGSGNEIVNLSGGARLELMGLTVTGNGSRRCVTASDPGTELLLHGATVQQCSPSSSGAAVYLSNSASLVSRAGTRFLNNDTSTDGGAIYASGSTLSITATTFDSNQADNGGAIRAIDTPVVVDGCTFVGNQATSGNGGGIHTTGTGTLTVVRSTFTSCTSSNHGGGVAHEGSGTVRLDYDAFDRCTASSRGGGAYVSTGATAQVTRSTFARGNASFGGGIYASLSNSAPIANNVLQDNACSTDGGGAWVSGSVQFQNNVLYSNDCGNGNRDGDGVMFDNATVAFRDNAVTNQPHDGAAHNGGAITSDYNLFNSNGGSDADFSVGTHSLTSSPSYVSASDDDQPNDNFLPKTTPTPSPMIDAGDPNVALNDTHGDTGGNLARGDIGIGGGPYGMDGDRDGITWPTDCRDDDAASKPGAAEVVGDGIDQDCDGFDSCYQDFDGDGYGGTSRVDGSPFCVGAGEIANATDCDDFDGATHPGAAEVAGDGIDQDCNTHDSCYVDLDNDGYGRLPLVVDTNDNTCGDANEAALGVDCDDADPSRSPGLSELPANGQDDDCDASELEDCYVDGDRDGYGGSTLVASADWTCGLSGLSGVDTDCADTVASIHPNTTDLPGDGTDNDCDTFEACWVDGDSDHYGRNTPATTVQSVDLDCADAGEASVQGDCNDGEPTVHTGASEVPVNSRDDNCDGSEICYADGDHDTHGINTYQGSASVTCSAPGVALTDDDCLDTDPSVYPGATETWNDTKDQDCNGSDTVGCSVDLDHDTYGTDTTIGAGDGTCDTAQGEASRRGDCNDAAPAINPSAVEGAAQWDDHIDQDCNGADTISCWQDGDADGDGDDARTVVGATDGVCNRAQHESSTATDCDDADPSVYYGAPNDVCGDGVDTDCMNPGDDDEDDDGLTFPQEQALSTDDCLTDSDGDTLDDGLEVFSAASNPASPDTDGDGVQDGPEWRGTGVDSDSDGVADILDPDDDGDGVPTANELTFVRPGQTIGDIDEDGHPNYLDTDDDQDGFLTIDEDRNGQGPVHNDYDVDGVPDCYDLDDDGDGVPTPSENGLSNPWDDDTDGDEVSDGIEWSQGDHDTDGRQDIVDPDDDGDGVTTLVEGLQDLDLDGVPNYLDDDSDCDGTTDSVEGAGDTDHDGFPNFADRNDHDGPTGDPDIDGLTTQVEQQVGSDPSAPDADDDLVADGVEATATTQPDTDADAFEDWDDEDDDGDGFTTREETGVLEDPALPACTGSWSLEARAETEDCGSAVVLKLVCSDDPATAVLFSGVYRDTDADGTPDYLDTDDDDDGVPTADEDPAGDEDGDGILDPFDLDPESGPGGDHDGDGLTNQEEEDAGGLEYYDDSDRDGISDAIEGPRGDTDGDTLSDFVDPDDDGDGVDTVVEGASDTDGDGTPDYLDTDSDDDGIPDASEADGDTDCDGRIERVDEWDDGLCDTGDGLQVRSTYTRQGCGGCDGTGDATPAVGGLAAIAAMLVRRRRTA